MNKELPIPPPLPPAFHRCNRITFKCNVSKKRTWLPFIVVTILSLILIGIAQPPLILGVFIVLSSIIFFGAFQLLRKTMYRNIEYTIENNILTISHPMRTLTIDIRSIKKIRRGDLLIDRRGCDFTASYPNIRILYNKNQYVYISPDDEHGFLRTLQKINPNIAFGKELHIT
ncbi:PH domain-containing protein [uncultured Duncaniella sp.]|uniref:PH domain-containing protein n=2 Tax=uncultured Duncaniella sp. TaxID=2768039 RepID=UPI0034A3BCA4